MRRTHCSPMRMALSVVAANLLLLMLVSSNNCAASALTAEWIQLQPSQTIAPRRSGHAAFVVADGDPSKPKPTPFIFGGYVEHDTEEENAYKRYVVNDLWKWKDSKYGWTAVECSGDLPGPRLATALAIDDSKAYLFGGWDPQTAGTGGIILDTVHSLDLTTHQWTKLDVAIPGGPTSRHVVVSIPNTSKILLHNHRCIDHVLIFDTATNTWQRQSTTGPCPSPRGLDAACVLDETRVLIFAGAAQDQTMSNEAFVLDTATWEWTQLDCNPQEQQPTPRASPCLVRVSDNCVVAFGGAEYSAQGLKPRADVWSLNVAKRQWTCLLPDDAPGAPPPRNAATLTEIVLDDGNDDSKTFLLTGGWAPFRETWDDCFLLKILGE